MRQKTNSIKSTRSAQDHMKRMFRILFLNFVIAASVFSISVTPARAAGVLTSPVGGGLIAAGVLMIVFSETAGGITALAGAGIGAAAGVGCSLCCCGCNSSPSEAISECARFGASAGAVLFGFAGGIASIVCGSLLLKAEMNTSDFIYSNLGEKAADKIRVSEEQRQKFNANLDLFNNILDSVYAEARRQGLREKKNVDPETAVNAMKLIWMQHIKGMNNGAEGTGVTLATDVEGTGVTLDTIRKITAFSVSRAVKGG